MSEINCQLEIPKQADTQLTVGQIFHLLCEGEFPKLKKDSLELRLEKEDQYKLKLLQFEKPDAKTAKLSLVSYQTGEHHLKAVQIVDADNSVVLGDLNFTVASVMDPEKPAEKPFGAMGPFRLDLSIWYPLSILIVVLVIAAFSLYRWKVRREKRKLLEDMRLDEAAQDAYFQFYQVARRAQRSYAFFSGAPVQADEMKQFVRDVDHAFRFYLARRFQVPTLKWSERRIFADLKSNHPEFYKEFRLDLRKVLAELSRAKAALEKNEALTAKDAEQLMDLLRKQTDRIENWQKGQKVK